MLPVTSTKSWNEKEANELLRNKSHKIHNKKDLDLLIDKISEAKIVMLGEATHGTHEFYTWRTYISQMIDEGMYNIGELVRTKYKKDDVFLLGFGTYKGRVIAGNSWDAAMHDVEVPEAKGGSWEYLLHQAGADNKLLFMDEFS